MQDVIRVPDQSIPRGAIVDVPLPALPAKRGKAVILKLKAISESSSPNGCFYATELRLNGVILGTLTSDHNVRLIGRKLSAELTSDRSGLYSISDSKSFLTMLAPDIETGDSMTKDGQGASFVLDISDIARGVDCNTLTARNNLNIDLGPGDGRLIVQGIEIGWADKNSLPRPEGKYPTRGSSADAINVDGMILSQSKGGGFTVRMKDGDELLVETALGIDPDSESALIADDAHTAKGVIADCIKSGSSSYRISATWPGLHLERTVSLKNGLISWQERWTNTQDKIIGVPFRHRLFLRNKPAGVMLAGSTDLAGVLGCSSNPTVFIESAAIAGNGFGVSAESDWLRLLMSLRSQGGIAEIYSENLALAPNSSIDFELTISPVIDGGGYWTFINTLRERWGLNRLTAERPVFWEYSLSPDGSTPKERLKRSLSDLGPICVAVRPWIELELDVLAIKAGKYPHLSTDSPNEQDVDIDRFLTYEHREPYWNDVAQHT
ncbi:MAG TPA: hypothetical protein VGK34_00925, partial [Armatimonadota bacterium]